MYFAFVYDHKYLKAVKDFYSNAIVSFYPAQSKEKVIIFLLFGLFKKTLELTSHQVLIFDVKRFKFFV